MKDDPDIVKILREEEQTGKLQGKFHSESIQISDSNSGPTQETIMVPKENLDKKEKTELQQFDDNYKIIFENYAVAITIVDQNERIFSWNKYTEDLFNMREEELYLKPIASLYPPDEWKRIRAENVRQKGIKYKMETKMLRKGKGTFDVELSLCILKGSGGKSVGSVGIIKDISQLKKTEKKLIESEERYKTIFENSAVAITLTNEKEQIISWNNYAQYLFGLGDKDLSYKPVESLYPPTEWKKIRAENVRQKGMQHHLETKIINNKNELIDVDLSLSVLKNHKGEVIGSIGVIKDITEQKRAEEALEESEKKFKLLYKRAPVPYHTLDPQGIITDVNEKWCNTLEYKKEEVMGQSIFDFINPIERKTAQASFLDKVKSRKDYTGGHERTFFTKSNQRKIFVIHDFLSFDKEKNVKSVHTTMEDITDRKYSETILKESEEKYRSIFELSPEAIILINTKGILLDANDRICDWLDYKKEEIIGKRIFELPFLPTESKIIAKKNFGHRMEENDLHPYELEFIAKTKEKKVGMVYGNPVRDKNQKIIGDLVVISDITQRKQVWNELVKSEEKYRVLAETSADGVFTTDTLGRLTYINPTLEKLLGRRKGKILATLFRSYLSESSVYLFQQVLLDVRKKNDKIENIQLDVVHQEGYEIPIEVNIAPLYKDDKFVGTVCTVRDVTEREKVVRELKKSENLRTEFMNIAAHELKSPVTPIKGYLELIESDKETSEQVKNWARIGLRNAERLLLLVNDILDVSRLDTDTMRFNMERADSKIILDDAAEDMRPAIEQKGLKFLKKIPKNLPKIFGDKYRLSQVLKNLIGNAIKFTDSGHIILRAETNDKYLFILVEDTGIGISKDELKKIFMKLYQAYTGEDRRHAGTGLGLYICKEIVKKHKGEIWSESEVGKGSKFVVKLPI